MTLALDGWELCLKATALNDREMVSKLSPQGQSALHLVGGLYKLGMASEEQLTWIQKEFVSVWKSTPIDTKCFPQALCPKYEQMEAVQSLSQKMRNITNCEFSNSC